MLGEWIERRGCFPSMCISQFCNVPYERSYGINGIYFEMNIRFVLKGVLSTQLFEVRNKV